MSWQFESLQYYSLLSNDWLSGSRCAQKSRISLCMFFVTPLLSRCAQRSRILCVFSLLLRCFKYLWHIISILVVQFPNNIKEYFPNNWVWYFTDMKLLTSFNPQPLNRCKFETLAPHLLSTSRRERSYFLLIAMWSIWFSAPFSGNILLTLWMRLWGNRVPSMTRS